MSNAREKQLQNKIQRWKTRRRLLFASFTSYVILGTYAIMQDSQTAVDIFSQATLAFVTVITAYFSGSSYETVKAIQTDKIPIVEEDESVG